MNSCLRLQCFTIGKQRRTVTEQPKSLSSVETGYSSKPRLTKRWSRLKRKRKKHSNHCHGKKRITNFEIRNTAPDESIMMLCSSHYVVAGSIGLSRRHMRPCHIVMDTGAGFNVIRSSAFVGLLPTRRAHPKVGVTG